ncbi:MAG: hypothetical protein OEW77_10960 [Gemmatimonadota bacterium]|nr:hypothetical protein [Gemmatimonadota bacterium]
MRLIQSLASVALGASMVLAPSPAVAQTPAFDPSARLREVLPADVAERVLARIAEARARELPAQAIENRALKFAARGVAPSDIEQSVVQQVERMSAAKGILESARPTNRPSADEIDAGGEAIRQGVDGSAVSDLARSAPSGRSLAVPLFVMGSLVERGLPSDEALARVRDRMLARASDAELEALTPARNAAAGSAGQVGLDRAGAARPGGTPGGPTGAGTPRAPTGVPQNGGKASAPTKVPPPPPARRP